MVEDWQGRTTWRFCPDCKGKGKIECGDTSSSGAGSVTYFSGVPLAPPNSCGDPSDIQLSPWNLPDQKRIGYQISEAKSGGHENNGSCPAGSHLFDCATAYRR